MAPQLRRSARVSIKRSNPDDVKVTKVKKVKKMSKPIEEDKEETIDVDTAEIEVGDNIPELTLLDEDGEEIDLVKAAKETKYLVIFAYPKASTPGCTRQACGFQKKLADLTKLDTQVFGLSADSPTAQKKFAENQGLEYHLLSDPKKELIGLLGAKKQPTGIKRSHWIFVDGVLKIKRIQISPEESFGSALDAIKEIK